MARLSMWNGTGFMKTAALTLMTMHLPGISCHQAAAAFCRSSRKRGPFSLAALVMLLSLIVAHPSQAQLFQNLQSLSQSIPVGSGQTDPNTGKRLDGPRWVCAADFDLDGNQDFAVCHLNGEISVGWGRGDGSFEGPQSVPSGTTDLRAIIAG